MLNWRELKGFNGTTTTNILYTYINFQSGVLSSDDDQEKARYRPTIGLKNTDIGDQSLGYILCNNAINCIEKPFIFHNNIILGTDNFTGEHDDTSFILNWEKSSVLQYLVFRDNSGSSERDFLTLTPTYFWMKNSGIEFDTTLSSTGSGNGFAVTSNFSSFKLTGSDKYFRIYEGTNNYLMHVGPSDNSSYKYRFINNGFYSTEPVNALYFNATSDKRAKESIKLLNTSVLNIVNQTPVYSFNYKKNKKPSLGILAQDIQNIDLNGFHLVDNLDATGENEDYMQLHESKLIYILWKAVQELSAEVNNLKVQLSKK